jgi:antitoxin CcdA
MDAHKVPASDPAFYDRRASKQPTSLRVNGDLLEKARELGIDLSATLEEALVTEVGNRKRELWLEENREAISAYNEHVAQHGVFSTGLRGF